MKGLITGFREFILRGNVLDLAVGIVIGAAFGAVVNALVEGILNPLIGAIFGQPNLDRIWTITINDSDILPGVFLTALLNFLLVALAIYLAVVVPVNRLAAMRRARSVNDAEVPPALAAEIVLLQEIRDLLAEGRSRPPAPTA
jgi:large conductance mechanosensitive channel